jgi:hypothetical protein
MDLISITFEAESINLGWSVRSKRPSNSIQAILFSKLS